MSIVFGFADSIESLDAIRFVQGLASACAWTAALAWLIAAVPADRRGQLDRHRPRSRHRRSPVRARAGRARRRARHRAGVCRRGCAGPHRGRRSCCCRGAPRRWQTAVRVLWPALFDRRLAGGLWLIALPALLFGTLTVLAPLAPVGPRYRAQSASARCSSRRPCARRCCRRRWDASPTVVAAAIRSRSPCSRLRSWPPYCPGRDALSPSQRARCSRRAPSASSGRPRCPAQRHGRPHRARGGMGLRAREPRLGAGAGARRRCRGPARPRDERRRPVSDPVRVLSRDARGRASRMKTLLVANRGRDRRPDLPHRPPPRVAHRRRRRRPTIAARSTPARPTSVVEIASYLDAAEHVRAARAERVLTPSIPATASSPRARRSPSASSRRGSSFVGPTAASAPQRRRQARREGDRPCGRRSRRSRRRARRDRVPARRQGGRGRRRSRHARRPRAGELEDALAAARREAEAAFGDDRVFCERYVERPRHVEIQLLARRSGTRRSPRRAGVLDPAPPPEGARGVSVAGARRRPAAANERRRGRVRARRSATASAGTAEFMVEGRDFWFLELNGRIQVEHPVTELVTRHRSRRAAAPRSPAGEPRVDASQPAAGHAVEVRLYAEDPRTFLPQAGRIDRLRLPGGRPGRRGRRGG